MRDFGLKVHMTRDMNALWKIIYMDDQGTRFLIYVAEFMGLRLWHCCCWHF